MLTLYAIDILHYAVLENSQYRNNDYLLQRVPRFENDWRQEYQEEYVWVEVLDFLKRQEKH